MAVAQRENTHAMCASSSRRQWLIACLLVFSGPTLQSCAEPDPGEEAPLCFEAELANDLTFPFEIIETEGASGKLALSVAEGAGCRESFPGLDTGTATFHISAPRSGRYFLFLRARWNGPCSNSCFVSVDDGDRESATDQVIGPWHWVDAGARKLDAGLHTLRLHNREDGILIDQLLLCRERMGPGRAAREPNLVPTPSAARRPEPSVFLSCTLTGIETLPPTDFLVRHKVVDGPVPVPRVPIIVFRSAAPVPLCVWLRSNSAVEATGTVKLSGCREVVAGPAPEQDFKLAKGEVLSRLDFTLHPSADLPRGLRQLFMRVHHGTGRVEGQRVYLLKPFQWLVTAPMPCPRETGIDTPGAPDAKVANGFPGTSGATRWKVAPDVMTTPFGLLDLRRAAGDRTYVMAYAYTRVHAPKDAEYLMSVRHDDMARIWLNGQPVLTSRMCVPSVCSRKLKRVSLKAGPNEILAKVCQLKNYWELGLSFFTLERKPAPVTGLSVAPLLEGAGDNP